MEEEKKTESHLFGKKGLCRDEATARKCSMYRNNQSRRARNGSDDKGKLTIKEKKRKIETRSDYTQLFSCFNFPPLFQPTFHRLFRYSTFRFIDRAPRKERGEARDSNSSSRKLFSFASEKAKEIKWNAKLNLAYPRLDWNRDGGLVKECFACRKSGGSR